MGLPRYKVATCSGFLVPREAGNSRPGLTALVLDRFNCHRVIARFRSEDKFGDGRTRGQDGALEAAEQRCAELNGVCHAR